MLEAFFAEVRARFADAKAWREENGSENLYRYMAEKYAPVCLLTRSFAALYQNISETALTSWLAPALRAMKELRALFFTAEDNEALDHDRMASLSICKQMMHCEQVLAVGGRLSSMHNIRLSPLPPREANASIGLDEACMVGFGKPVRIRLPQ